MGSLPAGMATLFRRAEWPIHWRGCDHLPFTANPGLLLRLEAALFELERFMAIDPAARGLVISAFGSAVRTLTHRLGARLVGSGTDTDTTLATLALSALPGHPDQDVAQRWCRVLAARGMRLGQPVKLSRRKDGRWDGSLRVSLSMPLIGELAGLDRTALAQRLERDMSRISEVLEAAQRSIVA